MIDVERLKTRLEATGLTANAASQKAGLGRDYVRDILRGRIQEPSALRLRRLASALDCTEAYLLGQDDSSYSLEELFQRNPDDRDVHNRSARELTKKIARKPERFQTGNLVDLLDTLGERSLIAVLFATFNKGIYDTLAANSRLKDSDVQVLLGSLEREVVDAAYERRLIMAKALGFLDEVGHVGGLVVAKLWERFRDNPEPGILDTKEARDILRPLLKVLNLDSGISVELVRLALLGSVASMIGPPDTPLARKAR